MTLLPWMRHLVVELLKIVNRVTHGAYVDGAHGGEHAARAAPCEFRPPLEFTCWPGKSV